MNDFDLPPSVFPMSPIGFYKSTCEYKFELPRQGVLASSEMRGEILLNPHCDFEQALDGLGGFERIWVVFVFHLNQNWKPKVRPPIPGERREKIGVFATRSPHRPNFIGMSCVKLEKIHGLKVTISGCDLVNDTPIVDIKPYLPYSDSFPESRVGWVEGQDATPCDIRFEASVMAKMDFLLAKTGLDFRNLIQIQLSTDPGNEKQKRVTRSQGDADKYCLAYRTWRIHYRWSGGSVNILDITSGYTACDMSDPEDPYHDKGHHRSFNVLFAE